MGIADDIKNNASTTFKTKWDRLARVSAVNRCGNFNPLE